MSRKLSLEQIRVLRLRAQRLHPEVARSVSGVAQLVKDVCGLQAQEPPSATLAVRARSNNLLVTDVKQAREDERSIVLTWCMRGTMHLVATEDLGWLLPLFGPIFIRKSQRRYTQLGLDQQTRLRATKAIREVLSNRGPLTRPELAEVLAAKGLPVEGQAIAHLVRATALVGGICCGPARDGELTYVVVEDWLKQEGKPKFNEEQIQAELARRYLEAYGPATPGDLASWSGISVSHARAGFKAISNELLEVELGDASAWMLKRYSAWLDESPGDPIVRLLPRFDGYLLGYQSRDFMVSGSYARLIHPGGGQIKQSLIVDGRAVGTWRRERKKNRSSIVIEPFEAISQVIQPDIEAEVQDIGRFLQEDTDLRFDLIKISASL